MAWSIWIPVARFLDFGWNYNPQIPREHGTYRFRVKEDSGGPHAGKIVYVGKASGKTTNICQRIGTFIAAGMGFDTQHSGGKAFYEQNDTGSKHGLGVRDLEVSWAIGVCPACTESEEYRACVPPPMVNRRTPKHCGRAECEENKRRSPKP